MCKVYEAKNTATGEVFTANTLAELAKLLSNSGVAPFLVDELLLQESRKMVVHGTVIISRNQSLYSKKYFYKYKQGDTLKSVLGDYKHFVDALTLEECGNIWINGYLLIIRDN